MPRGRRKNYTEKLAVIQGEIETLEGKLKELRQQEKELLKEKKEEELRHIADILDEKKIPTEELVTILSQSSQKEES